MGFEACAISTRLVVVRRRCDQFGGNRAGRGHPGVERDCVNLTERPVDRASDDCDRRR